METLARKAHIDLVRIETDTHPLDGLYYTPVGPTRAQAMILHGNCMNFYTGAARFLPERLAELGIATLAFNRRGHDIMATLNSREAVGGAFQRIDEAIADNTFAEGWLRAQWDRAPIVIGHSNGGMLAVRHCAGRSDIPGMILLSAHQGGAGMVPFASGNGLLAQDRLTEVTLDARARVADGRGQELMLLPGWWYAVTANSFLDNLEKLPELLPLAAEIQCPSLFVAGGLEPPEMYPAKAFAARTPRPCTVQIVPECDHFYSNHEDVVSGIVTDWLAQNVLEP